MFNIRLGSVVICRNNKQGPGPRFDGELVARFIYISVRKEADKTQFPVETLT